MLIFVILFASVVSYNPGLAQSSASASSYANAVATGGSASSASASSYSYASSWESNGNGEVLDCTWDKCTPTCSLPYPQNCPFNSNPCNCTEGSVVSKNGGKCVPKQDCSKYVNCKIDNNSSYDDCPLAIQSTCAKPNAQFGNTQCATPTCVCNYGYILSSPKGTCIKTENCPGGKVCGKNEIFLNCLVECPSLYCPVDESRVACGPSKPCPSGCGCKSGYLWKSVKDKTCIPKSECPPGKCYDANAEWNSCVSVCYSEKCETRNKVPLPEDCLVSMEECYPRCLCKKGMYRNANYTCVPAKECPK